MLYPFVMVLQYPIACSLSSLRLVAWRLWFNFITISHRRQVTCCLVKRVRERPGCAWPWSRGQPRCLTEPAPAYLTPDPPVDSAWSMRGNYSGFSHIHSSSGQGSSLAKALWFFGDTLVLSRLRILCLIPIELDPRSIVFVHSLMSSMDQGSRARSCIAFKPAPRCTLPSISLILERYPKVHLTSETWLFLS